MAEVAPKFNVVCCCSVEPAAGVVVADTFELAPKFEAETEEENNEVGLLVAVAAAAGAVAAAPKENPDAVAWGCPLTIAVGAALEATFPKDNGATSFTNKKYIIYVFS